MMSRYIRIGLWGSAMFLWLLPLTAMQFTDEVNWTGFDFAIFGFMLILACGAYELTVRLTANKVHRTFMAIALVVVFLIIWAQGAVGIIE
jgi:hypothetical protein